MFGFALIPFLTSLATLPGASLAIGAWGFLMSPLGKKMAIGVLGLTIWGYAEHRGAERVRVEWDAANAAAKVATESADKEVAKKADKLDMSEVAKSADADKANSEARNAYIVELEKRIANNCGPATPDSIKRLRGIR